MFLADLQLDCFLSGLPPTITHSSDAQLTYRGILDLEFGRL